MVTAEREVISNERARTAKKDNSYGGDATKVRRKRPTPGGDLFFLNLRDENLRDEDQGERRPGGLSVNCTETPIRKEDN
jgi:hypothetical protein